jgi:hypothetical protein
MTNARMKPLLIVTVLALAGTPIAARAGTSFLASADPWLQQESRAGDRESDLYRQGADALGDEDWEEAVARFNEVIKMGGERTEGALHWKTFALHKLGRRSEALATIAELRKSHPKSRWLKEAGALEIEIRADSGKPPRPEAQPDDDLKLLALNRLMESDPDRAIPLVERFLSGDGSPKLKEHALFVLAQSDSPKASALMGRIARGQVHPQLQTKALHNLGIHGGREAMQTLSEIYASSRSVEVKKSILNAFAIAGATDRLVEAALQETDYDELVEAAIQGLGVAGGRTELRKLYREVQSQEAKADILQAAGIVADDEEFLAEIVRAEKDPELRRQAIHAMGVSGGRNTASTLVAIYNAETDKQTRRAVVEALFVSDNAGALVSLARKETDPQMKRDIVQKLSLMDNPEATDYMMQILEQ